MFHLYSNFCFLLILFVASSVPIDGQAEWKVKSNSRGWKISEKIDPHSSIRATRVETTLSVRSELLWRVISDVENWESFMPRIEKATIVGEHPGGIYVYQVLSTPRLMPNIDCAMKVFLYEVDSGLEYRRTWAVDNSKAPNKKKGVERIKLNQGMWKLEALSEKETRVTVEIMVDPGGRFSKALVNFASQQGLKKMIGAIEKEAIDRESGEQNVSVRSSPR